MNKKHRRTLQMIFTTPVCSDVRWEEVESLVLALGAQISEGRGSRVRISLNSIKAVFHKPHPTGKPICKCDVKALKDLLEGAGFLP